MREKKNNNSGFTLIELVVAIAIMALLMAAVCSLMAQNTITYKKTKADISVQNSAQATYDCIADAVMQASSIQIEGYITGNMTAADAAILPFSTTEVGKTDSTSLTAVKGMRASDIAALTPAEQAACTDFTNFKLSGGYKNVYVTKMVIKYSVPIEPAYMPTGTQQPVTYADGTTKMKMVYTISDGGTNIKVTEDDEDICTVTFQFDGKNMYVGRTYKYMTAKNDMWAASATDLSPWLYASSLNYMDCNGDTVSGVIAQIDAENGSLGIDLLFADKSMSYTTNGMINLRNSYVLKDAK